MTCLEALAKPEVMDWVGYIGVQYTWVLAKDMQGFFIEKGLQDYKLYGSRPTGSDVIPPSGITSLIRRWKKTPLMGARMSCE